MDGLLGFALTFKERLLVLTCGIGPTSTRKYACYGRITVDEQFVRLGKVFLIEYDVPVSLLMINRYALLS